MKPLVAIVVLNWNGWQDTLECLESLYQITYPNYQVILVDNHSQDQSLEKIREYCQGHLPIESPFFTYQTKNKPIKITELTNKQTKQQQTTNKITEQATKKNNQENNKTENNPEKNNGTENNPKKTTNIDKNQQNQNKPSKTITLIKNNKNYGFAQGNNIAIKYTLKKHNPDYILLLNNDTIVDPEFLTEMVKTAENDDKIGILGPLIYYYEWQGRNDVVANLGGKVDISKYPGYYDLTEVSCLEDYSGHIIECDWVSGAALLMKSRDLPSKFLNEKLFFGCEDIDLALLLKEYGYKSVVVLDSHIWHKEGVSRKKRSSGAVRRALMEIKSNLTFLKAHNKHYYWYLPLYLLQIVKLYVMVVIKR